MIKKKSFKTAAVLFAFLTLVLAMLPFFPQAEEPEQNDAYTVTFPSASSRAGSGYSIKDAPGGTDIGDTMQCSQGSSFYILIDENHAFSGKLWGDIISFSPDDTCHVGVTANNAKTEFRVTITSISGNVSATIYNVLNVSGYRNYLEAQLTEFNDVVRTDLNGWNMTETTRNTLLSRLQTQYDAGISALDNAAATISAVQSAYDTSRNDLFQIDLIGDDAFHLNEQYEIYTHQIQNTMQDLTEEQRAEAQTQLDAMFADADSATAEATTGGEATDIFIYFINQSNPLLAEYKGIDLSNAKASAQAKLDATTQATMAKILAADFLDDATKQDMLIRLAEAYGTAREKIDSVDTWSEKFMVGEYLSRFMKVVDEINAEIDSKAPAPAPAPAPEDNNTDALAISPSTGDLNLVFAIALAILILVLGGSFSLRYSRNSKFRA